MNSDLGPEKPFPGLRPYGAADHEWFFGRDEQCLSLYSLLDRGGLVAVVGSSGSGKSSIVRAGLLPLLDAEKTPAGESRWRWWELRPGDTPMARLAATLAGPPPTQPGGTARAVHACRHQQLDFLLRKSSFGLVDVVREVGPPAGTTPLLLVDQFEELFRFADIAGSVAARNARREEAAAFVQLLLEATRSAETRLRVIITLRSDYLGDCSRFLGLPEAVNASQFLVPSLTRDQRAQAIRSPIEKAGGSIDDDLVEQLLNDSSEELDQLPVLQHALMRTWNQTARPHRLTRDGYKTVGGIATAISRHADELLDEPELRQRGSAVEQVFRALAELDRHRRAIRRPLAFGQLVAETGQDEADVRVVVDRFRRDDCSFLVPPILEGRPLGDRDIIDVGHEALIRRWTRMIREVDGVPAGWLIDEVADGRTYMALVELARGEPALLPVEQTEGRRTWWDSRQRTPAWADRYGGAFDNVQKLLADSEENARREAALKREADEKARLERARERDAQVQSQNRESRRQVLRDTQLLAFLGVFVVAVAMNWRVYQEPPFSWLAILGVFVVTSAIFFLSPGSETQPAPTPWQFSLDQTVLAYFAVDLLALGYLIWNSGGLVNSPFTVFLLLLPMNGVFLEEGFRRVAAYFALVFVAATGLAVAAALGLSPVPTADPWHLAIIQMVLLVIAFGTALVGYQRMARQRQDSGPRPLR